MADQFSALSKQEEKKTKPVSNAGGECAIVGCSEPATATNAVSGLKNAKWYCSAHLKAMNNGANYNQLNMITARLKRDPIKRVGHWTDRLMAGVSVEQLKKDDAEILNDTHEKAKF